VRAILALGAAVIAAIALFEVTMQPSAAERSQLLGLFIAMAAGTVVLGWLLPRITRGFRSLRSSILVLAVASVLSVAVATGIAARLMFLETHDLQLLTVVLGFGVGLGVVLATTMASQLTRGLENIGRTANEVAAGDLTARTGVDRTDELGQAAAAVDRMTERLAIAEVERDANDAARRHFLAAVGHDLRSPLAALRAAVEALEDGLAPDPERYLRSMRADVDAMAHLVDDLFLLATIEAGRLEIESEPFDLAEIADESIDALRPVAESRNVDLRLDAAGSVPTVGGPEALGRVMRNLLHNAIRFSPANAEVVVSVHNGTDATVIVADEGPGFSPSMVDSAFEEFITDDPARTRSAGGAGLGLAIARGIVTAHGGSIWAELGPGGRVGFRLPVGR
jgi:two-component system sensor histidine kinase BaeS